MWRDFRYIVKLLAIINSVLHTNIYPVFWLHHVHGSWNTNINRRVLSPRNLKGDHDIIRFPMEVIAIFGNLKRVAFNNTKRQEAYLQYCANWEGNPSFVAVQRHLKWHLQAAADDFFYKFSWYAMLGNWSDNMMKAIWQGLCGNFRRKSWDCCKKSDCMSEALYCRSLNRWTGISVTWPCHDNKKSKMRIVSMNFN